MTAIALGKIGAHIAWVDIDGDRYHVASIMRTTYGGRPALVIEAYDGEQRYQIYAEIPQDEQEREARPRLSRP